MESITLSSDVLALSLGKKSTELVEELKDLDQSKIDEYFQTAFKGKLNDYSSTVKTQMYDKGRKEAFSEVEEGVSTLIGKQFRWSDDGVKAIKDFATSQATATVDNTELEQKLATLKADKERLQDLLKQEKTNFESKLAEINNERLNNSLLNQMKSLAADDTLKLSLPKNSTVLENNLKTALQLMLKPTQRVVEKDGDFVVVDKDGDVVRDDYGTPVTVKALQVNALKQVFDTVENTPRGGVNPVSGAGTGAGAHKVLTYESATGEQKTISLPEFKTVMDFDTWVSDNMYSLPSNVLEAAEQQFFESQK